jgi:hypothetical protein
MFAYIDFVSFIHILISLTSFLCNPHSVRIQYDTALLHESQVSLLFTIHQSSQYPMLLHCIASYGPKASQMTIRCEICPKYIKHMYSITEALKKENPRTQSGSTQSI